MKKVLITGGAGFIGSILVSKLLEQHYEVVVLDNFTYGQTTLLGLCHNPKLHIIRGDVRDRGTIGKALKGIDFVLPLAAIVGAPACDRDPVAARTINLDAIKMLKGLLNINQKVIFPCTNSGYGVGEEGIYCDENTPLRPVSLYGRTKVEAEKVILKAGNSISLRLATVFGTSPMMKTDILVNNFVYRAVADGYLILFEGHFKRNYIHVRDVAKAFLHCMENFDKMKGEAYNVGLSNANCSKLELCQEIKKQIPNFYFVEAEVGEDIDRRNYIVSNAKIEATGYKPDYTLQDGITELIKGYQIIRGVEVQGNVPKR